MNAPHRHTLLLPEGAVSQLEWDGAGPLLHFAHATGFNAETYRGLLSPLSGAMHIVASDQRGHGFSTLPTASHGTRDWIIYRDDLIAILERLDRGPAILIGHSMGATVSLMAAALRPDRVKALVLVEPVLIPKRTAFFHRFPSLRGRNSNHTLRERAAQRRDSFPSFDAALAAYTGRGAFRTWKSETIEDYLRGGLREDPDHHLFRLTCNPVWESETFRGAPSGMAKLVRRVKCPATLVYGTIASSCWESEVDILRRAGVHAVKADGASHFLPMEYPDLVRHEITRIANV